jgi:hypothetical protein
MAGYLRFAPVHFALLWFSPLRILGRLCGLCTNPLADQWVFADQFRERGKIPVSGPQFFDAVVQANRSDAGIVDLCALYLSCSCLMRKRFEVAGPLSQHTQASARLPCLQRLEGGGEWSRWIVNFRMRHNGNKLVETGPRYRPGSTGICELSDPPQGLLVPCGVLPMCINENIGINGNQQ